MTMIMNFSFTDIEYVARLAYLDFSAPNSPLHEEINAIMNFIEQIQLIDTTGVAPLFHPLDQHQRFREDKVTESECTAQLEKLAPLFKDNLYLVPKVIESGK